MKLLICAIFVAILLQTFAIPVENGKVLRGPWLQMGFKNPIGGVQSRRRFNGRPSNRPHKRPSTEAGKKSSGLFQ
uniref:Uncharacterized protein n=1 Tax=Panagrolaimus davidi TaxID=227884 RepID=A0A914QW06_9BILA